MQLAYLPLRLSSGTLHLYRLCGARFLVSGDLNTGPLGWRRRIQDVKRDRSRGRRECGGRPLVGCVQVR